MGDIHSPETPSRIHDHHVPLCRLVTAQGCPAKVSNGKRKISSVSISQTCSVYLEMRDLPLSNSHEGFEFCPGHMFKAQHPPTGDPVNQQSLHTDAGPLIFPTREAMAASICREVGKGLRPRLWSLLSAAGESKDPFQSPLDPGLSHFLISHLHSLPLPILSVQV